VHRHFDAGLSLAAARVWSAVKLWHVGFVSSP
jgi:hypothetical protein